MNKTIRIIILSALLCLSAGAWAQVDGFGLRTNLLGWAMLSPGMGADISWNSRYLFAVDGSYGNWDITPPDRRVRVSSVGAELRRYFSNGTSGLWANPNGGRYRGFYLGVDGRYIDFDSSLASPGCEGSLVTAGLLAGYSFRLRGNWGVDASIGAGYVHRDYTRYEWYVPAQMNRKVSERTGGGFGLTNLNVSITYRFNQ